MNAPDKKPQAVLSRLSVMMFLQFFAWGAWFATLALAMSTHNLGAFIGGAYESAPIAAIFAPLFLGLIADRFFASDKVMAVLLLIGGGLMCLLPGMAADTKALYEPVKASVQQLEQTPEGKVLAHAALITQAKAALEADKDTDLIKVLTADDDKEMSEADKAKRMIAVKSATAFVKADPKGKLADGLAAYNKVIDEDSQVGEDTLKEVAGYAEESPGTGVVAAFTSGKITLGEETKKTLAKHDDANSAYLKSGGLIVWVMIAYMLCYMPTLGLGNSITFTHLPQEQFPKARVWGTIGWIAAGLGLGAVGWSDSLNIFWLGAVSSLMLGVYAFTLPKTPPPAKGKPLDLGSLFMLDAFKLLKDPPFAVFAICSFLICIPLAYYYGQTSNYLGAAGFKEAGAAMTLGQMSEIIFMLLIPFFFRRLGVKVMLLIGMGCWVLRYALFALAAPDQMFMMIMLGIALHGICYDFFFVTGFIYTDKKAPAEIRGQAQSLLVFLTQGLGMFIGFRMAFGGSIPFTGTKIPNSVGEYGAAPANHQALISNIAEAKGEQPAPSFIETMTGMFGKGYPDGIDETLRDAAMKDWANYWLFPAGMAAVIMIIFAVAFWDKVKTDDVTESEAAEALPEDAPA